MRDYIIFKNIKSSSLDGLMICELPPITKPEMRTSIIEIDGKDGDIIEELGYASYQKTLQIGLTRNFDINQIIKYFSGSGDLVLSNEPDKVYKATIYSKVDYEKLLRFKTAEVEFHVQPYKYLLNEAPFELNITNETELKVSNVGLEKSKPIITLYGEGEIQISINGSDIFSINIDDEYVVVNSIEEEAYKENVLKNRNMLGEFPILEIGINTIKWTGNLKKIIIEPKSRWI
ncbi:MAG: phage tail family protein [Bacilli bacterium]|nr:phage tail family protein [Bacilli bacterium]